MQSPCCCRSYTHKYHQTRLSIRTPVCASLQATPKAAKSTQLQQGGYEANVDRQVNSTLLRSCCAVALATALSTCLAVGGASARLEGVNKPELLPKTYTPVIDVAGFLTPGEEQRIRREVESLERDTGIKLRVLAQNYPETPGLAIKDFWKVDDDTVVFVADPNTGNILNFNVGGNIDLRVPTSFWSRLAGKFGTKKWWETHGQEAAIVNAVSAIDTCLREPPGRFQCSKVQSEFEEDLTAKKSGFFGF